jgi:uncharacterized membrane protein YdjX (TVP38/TMEM64 family)
VIGGVSAGLRLVRSWLRPVIGFGCVVGLLWLLHRLLPDTETLIAWGRGRLDADPLEAVLYFLVIGSLFTAVGLPRQAVALAGGYFFGAVTGTTYSLLAMLGGSMLTFHIASALRIDRLSRIWPGASVQLERWTHGHVFAKTLMIRLLPVGNNLLTNVLAGLARVPRVPFFFASVLGFLPQTLVFALGGTSVSTSSTGKLILACLLLLISLAIANWLRGVHAADVSEAEGNELPIH